MNGHQLPQLQREIVIRTPENIELRYALAGAGSRAAAYFVDLVIMYLISQILGNLLMYLATSNAGSVQGAGAGWVAAIATLIFFCFYNGYFMFFEWLMNGQTPGKRVLRIRVIKQGGYALGFFETLLRNLLRLIDFIPFFYGVGLVSLLLTRNSQRLGDLVAGTYVIHQEEIATESLLLDLPAPAPMEQPLPAAQVAAVPAAIVTLASEFWLRRSELAPRARQEIGVELVDLVRQSSGLNPPTAQSSENFLAAVIRQSERIPTASIPLPQEA